jgi:hypothetical protein
MDGNTTCGINRATDFFSYGLSPKHPANPDNPDEPLQHRRCSKVPTLAAVRVEP